MGWLLAFATDAYGRNTYESENALLSGQAKLFFDVAQLQHVDAFRSQLDAQQPMDEVLVAYLMEQHVLHDVLVSASNPLDKTVYAWIPSTRGDHTEALVVCAPQISRQGKRNANGLSLLAGLIHLFKTTRGWTRDILLVAPYNGHSGVQEWLAAYHGSSSHFLSFRSGEIQAALVLDFDDISMQDWHAVKVGFVGLNGQLPNLDLVNIAISIAGEMGVPIQLETSVDHKRDIKHKYIERFYNILQMMKLQLSSTYGSHAFFHSYKIDAITLGGRTSNAHSDRYLNFREVGRHIESVMRSLNNIEEHLHQSFFFYILSDEHTFISIANYLPPLLLLFGTCVLEAIRLYTQESEKGSVSPWFVVACVASGGASLATFFLPVSTNQVLPGMAASFYALAVVQAMTSTGWIATSHVKMCVLLLAVVLSSTIAVMNFTLGLLICLPFALISLWSTTKSAIVVRVAKLIILTALSPAGLSYWIDPSLLWENSDVQWLPWILVTCYQPLLLACCCLI